MKQDCIVFDLDGVLADDSVRVKDLARPGLNKLIMSMTKEERLKFWFDYTKPCVDDKPIPHMHNLFQALREQMNIVIVTARTILCEEETKQVGS